MSISFSSANINTSDIIVTTSGTVTKTTENVVLCPYTDTTNLKYVTEIKCNKLKLPTTYDDMVVDLSGVSTGSAPSYSVIPGSSNLRAYDLNTTDKYLYFSAQIPHKWKIGTDLKPHLHAIVTLTNQNVSGTLGMTLNNSIMGYKETLTRNDLTCSMTIQTSSHNKEIILPFTTITPYPTENISSILLCSLRATTLGNISNIYVLSFDFHYEADHLGSSNEYTQ